MNSALLFCDTILKGKTMNNFIYSIPTEIYFGKGQIKHLADAIKQVGTKVLLLYGGGSIKKAGIYDTVISILEQNDIAYSELGGVDPNPRIETVVKGRDICREEGVNLILPVGGGSTIDCAKAIAAAVFYDGDPWDLILDHSKIGKALPIITVLTLSATGTEMNTGGVITNFATNQKMAISSPNLRPVASVLDPEYTFTVSEYQTASGTVDIMSHVLEQYFSRVEGAFVQDKFAEGLLQTCIKYGPIALGNPNDYEARSNLMWASTWALNGFIGAGKGGAWSVHPMEHELSAFYDITHGVGLAILTPHWMRYVLDETSVEKFSQYAYNVWGVVPSGDKFADANAGIDKTAEFFTKTLGVASTLAEVGIGEDKLEIMAEKASNPGVRQFAYKPLAPQDVLAIFKAALK